MRGLWKNIILAVIAISVLSVFAAGCGRDSVAKVNGRKITKEEYYSRLERSPVPGGQPGQQMEAGAYVLQQMVNEELILGLARQKKVEPTDAQVKERITDLKKRQPNLDKQMKDLGITEEQLDQMMRVQQGLFNLRSRGVKVSEKEMKDYYEQNKALRYTEPEQAKVALILAANKADADSAMEMLKKGIQFGTVAQAKSMHDSKNNGGVLPTPIRRGSGSMGAGDAMQNAIFKTDAGKYTQPISTENGAFAIFQVMEKTPQTTKSFDDVKYEINQILLLQKGAQKNNVDKELEDFRGSADINIGIERYKDKLNPEPGEAHSPDDGHGHK